MAVMNSGLGGPAGYGENTFSSSPKALGDNDDGAVQVDVTSVFSGGIDFFGSTYSDIFINSNGAITFGAADDGYDQSGANDFTMPALLPFYSDTNIGAGGEIYWDLDPAAGQITVTWLNVAPFSGSGANSFQAVLTDLGGGDMGVEYIYGDIQWSASASDPAFTGFTDGAGVDFALEFSNDSSGLLGYESNDFGNGDPAGTYSFVTSGGVPDVLEVTGTSGGDVMGLGFVGASGSVITNGDDLIDGGAGDDAIDAAGGNDTVQGGAGNDTIDAGATERPITWTDVNNGADLHGTSGQDYFRYVGGGGSSATIRMNDSIATANAGDGLVDYLHVDTTADAINLMIGDFDVGTDKIVLNEAYVGVAETVYGPDNVAYTITYASGNQQTFDIFFSSASISAAQVFTTTLPTTASVPDNDSLLGGDDADTFEIGDNSGNDTIIGGEGGSDSDTIDLSAVTAGGVTVSFSGDEAGTITNGSDTLTFSEIEAFTLTDAADSLDASGVSTAVTIDGGFGNDTLTTGSGDDVIDAFDGDDLVDAGAGNDTLFAGYGIDTLFGGTGNDTYLIQGSSAEMAGYQIDLGTNTDQWGNEYYGIETIIGGAADEQFIGDGVANRLEGQGGNDRLDGGAGNDTLDGGDGDDTLIGGAGKDSLIAGNNTGAGDLLQGGAGNDTLVDSYWNATLEGGDDSDVFNVGFGRATIVGGEGGKDLDTLSFRTANDAVSISYTGNEAGTYTDADGDSGIFSEIERLSLTTNADSVDASATTAGLAISGESGNDTLIGGSGSDTLNGIWDDDSLLGGDGNDSVYGGYGNDTVFGDDGDDTISGGRNDDLVYGGSGADSLFYEFDQGNDTVYGGEAGNDQDTLGAVWYLSNSVVVTYTGDEAGTLVFDGDTINFFEIEAQSLTSGNDSLDGTASTVGFSAWGNDGNDTLAGGSGADLLFGGVGNDQISYAVGGDTVDGGDGDDTIWGGFVQGVDDASLSGGAGNDSFVTYGANDTVLGGAGLDTIVGESGDEWIDGGADADKIWAGSGSDTVYGGSGNDTIEVDGGGADKIFGGTGSDSLVGYADSQTFVQEDGFGTDTILGGEGRTDADAIDATALTSGVTATFSGDEAGKLTDGADTLTFSQIERLDLTDHADSVDGTADTVGLEINAGAGDDTLKGGTGADLLQGGADADTFVVVDAFGNDTLVGGETVSTGNDRDTIDLSAVTVPLTVIVNGTGAGTISDGTHTIAFSQIERIVLNNDDNFIDLTNDTGGIEIVAGSGNDTLIGGAGGDTLSGGLGNDSIEGGDGDDLLMTGSGNDTLVGGEGNDTLMNSDGDDSLVGGTGDDSIVATGGDDTLEGGAGNDTLSGGADNDLLIGGAGSDVLDGGAGNDTLKGDGDNQITLSIGGSDRGGINPEYEVYADGVLIHSGFVTWAQDGASPFDPNAPGAFQDVVIVLSGALPSSVAVTFVNDSELGDESFPGEDRNLHLDKITVGETVYEAETEAVITNGGGPSGNNVNLWGTDSTATFDTTTALSGSGDDTISGGAGNDVIEGGAGADSLDGGDGVDTFLVEDGFGNDTIIGGEGGTDFDTIDLSALTVPVTVTYTGDEAGTITDGTHTISFSQIERLVLTDLADVIDASADSAGIPIEGGDGDDTIIGSAGDDKIQGQSGNDSIAGGNGEDLIISADGDAYMSGGAGNDTIQGSTGADTVEGGGGADSITGGAGDDVLSGEGVPAPLVVLNFEDGASGTAADSTANGIDGIYQGDATAGGTGWTGSGTAAVLDGDGDYIEIADNSAFQLSEGTVSIRFNADKIENGDTLFSRDSNDFDGGGHIRVNLTANGTVQVRIQSDTTDYSFSSASGIVTTGTWHHVALSFGSDGLELFVDGASVATNPYTGGITGNKEPWTLGADQRNSSDGVADKLHDYFVGRLDEFALYDTQLTPTQIARIEAQGVDAQAPGNDTVDGGTGADTISGGGGDDSLTGGDDADTFLVEDGFGNDTIVGGEGGTDSDTIDGSAVTGDISVVFGASEAGSVTDGTDTITFSEIENVFTGSGDDLIDARLDTSGIGMFGFDGADTILGSRGADYIDGGAGADSLEGGASADTILGGDGSDRIEGGAGNDLLTGGSGDDTFVLSAGGGADTITDFDMADDDSDGVTNDQLDVTDLSTTKGGSTPIHARDVVVSDDGSGNALLTFPSGETVVLFGVAPSQIDEANEMHSAGIACFTKGTLIDTPRGPVPVERLSPGDLVTTRDHGPQPLHWVGARHLSAATLVADPRQRPIKIRKGALGNRRALWVSPQHGMLLDARLGFDAPRFARAKHLAERFPGVHIDRRARGVSYYHLLCPTHSVLFAEGIPTESFYPGLEGVLAYQPASLAALTQVLPGILSRPVDAVYGPTAYPFLRRKDFATIRGLPTRSGGRRAGAPSPP